MRHRPSAAGSVISIVAEEFSYSVALLTDCSLACGALRGRARDILVIHIIASLVGPGVAAFWMWQLPDRGSF